MKILILGGTIFLGRHIVEESLERGHEVTLFNRGIHGKDLFPELERVQGDRDGGLDVLRGRKWDAVVDTSGYVPRIVRASARFFSNSADHYTFISSLSVFINESGTCIIIEPDADESDPVVGIEDETTEEVNSRTYGALKALCEKAAEAEMRGRVLNVRPGLIVGPYDPSDRFTYWPYRVTLGGEILAPGKPERRIQYIDARSLAEWIVRMIEKDITGAFNATGPSDRLTMKEFLDACKHVVGNEPEFIWVEEKFLLDSKVSPYQEMPLWMPGVDDTFRANKAINNGLTFRRLDNTIKETLEWNSRRPESFTYRAGLKPEKERAILESWKSRVK